MELRDAQKMEARILTLSSVFRLPSSVFYLLSSVFCTLISMPSNEGIPEKLDTIIIQLDALNRRDRLRTWGSFARGLISLIPMAIFLWSIWYFTQHADELLKKIADESAKAAATYTENKSNELMQQIQKMMPKR